MKENPLTGVSQSENLRFSIGGTCLASSSPQRAPLSSATSRKQKVIKSLLGSKTSSGRYKKKLAPAPRGFLQIKAESHQAESSFSLRRQEVGCKRKIRTLRKQLQVVLQKIFKKKRPPRGAVGLDLIFKWRCVYSAEKLNRKIKKVDSRHFYFTAI